MLIYIKSSKLNKVSDPLRNGLIGRLDYLKFENIFLVILSGIDREFSVAIDL